MHFHKSSDVNAESLHEAVLEMAGRQVAKCDQKSFWATSFGQKYVYCRPKNYVWATNSESMDAL